MLFISSRAFQTKQKKREAAGGAMGGETAGELGGKQEGPNLFAKIGHGRLLSPIDRWKDHGGPRPLQ